MLNKKLQASMEYLMIVGFVAVIAIPMVVLYYTYTQGSNNEIVAKQAESVAKRIVDAAEKVYYMGEPSQITLRVYLPNSIAGAVLQQNEVYFRIKLGGGGETDVVQLAAVNMSGSLPVRQGTYLVTVKAGQNGAIVSYK